MYNLGTLYYIAVSSALAAQPIWSHAPIDAAYVNAGSRRLASLTNVSEVDDLKAAKSNKSQNDALSASSASSISSPTSSLEVTKHLTGTTAEATVDIHATAKGSGVNGPRRAQQGIRVQAFKDGWFTRSALVGELDGLNVLVRQGGDRSDTSGMLIDVQNTGQGFLSSTEMASSVLNPTTNRLTHGIDIQDGILNDLTHAYIGRAYTVTYGEASTAMLVQNKTGTSWTNVLRNIKNGVTTLNISDDGNINTLGSVRAKVFSGAGTFSSLGVGLEQSAPGGKLSLTIPPPTDTIGSKQENILTRQALNGAPFTVPQHASLVRFYQDKTVAAQKVVLPVDSADGHPIQFVNYSHAVVALVFSPVVNGWKNGSSFAAYTGLRVRWDKVASAWYREE